MSDGVVVSTVQESIKTHEDALANAAKHIDTAAGLMRQRWFSNEQSNTVAARAQVHVAIAEAIMLGVWVEHQIHDGLLAP